jgi:hypothetical protein
MRNRRIDRDTAIVRGLLVVAIALAVLSIGCCVAAILTNLQRSDVRWGDVGGWVGGIGALLAAVAAVGIAVYDNNKDHNQALNRARRRANRVEVHWSFTRIGHPMPPDLGIREQSTFMRNLGENDIYEVRWFPPIIAYFIGDEYVGVQWGGMAATDADFEGATVRTRVETAPAVGALPPKQGSSIFFTVVDRPQRQSTPYRIKPFLAMSFVDQDGFRLGWIYDRSQPGKAAAEDPTLSGRWEVVGDDYPTSISGAFRELRDEIKRTNRTDLIPPEDDGYRGSSSFREYKGLRPGDAKWTNTHTTTLRNTRP